MRNTLCYLLVVGFFVSACGGTTGTPTSAPATIATQPPATSGKAPGDTLRWSLEGLTDLRSIDPAKPGDSAAVTVISLIFQGLIRLNEALEIQPDGASDWKVSEDGTVYTFTIRQGLRFADGTPVTAEDFAASINRALAPETASFGAPSALRYIVGAEERAKGTTTTVSGIKVLDPATLQITLSSPVAYFLTQLTYPYTFVVPKQAVSAGPEWFENAFGTGPYRVEEWKRGQYIQLTANENYWGGQPGVPKVRFSFNKDSETAFQLYQVGELDILGSAQTPLPAARIAEVQTLPDFKTTTALTTRYVGFNNQLAPFDNVDVRRAFAQAVDKTALAQVLTGVVLPADRILPPGLLGTQLPIKPLDFDATAAKESLARAGYPDGQGLPAVTLVYGQEGDNETVVQALQRFWEQNLGVKVNLQALDIATFSDQLDTTYKTPEQGIQFYYSVWGADYPDPQNFLSQQLRGNTANNNGHWQDATFDQLVNEADRLGDRTQIDRRIKLYNQAEQIAIDKVGWLPLCYPKFNVLLNPRVEGFVITPIGFLIPDWSKVRLKS